MTAGSDADWERLLAQATDNLRREYPIHWTQVLQGEGDLRPHRELHPLFGGSFDWHSCVHQTWLVARLLRTQPDLTGAADARAALDDLLTVEHGRSEAAFFAGPATGGWERPYGWAWLLLLDAELRTWDVEAARRWSAAVAPLATVLRHDWIRWLGTASRPVRAGLHQNTAFSAGLVLDVARALDDRELYEVTAAAALRFFTDDEAYGAIEPDAADFLSPLLCEVDLMRRVLAPEDFGGWLAAFVPDLGEPRWRGLRTPVTIEDGRDGHGAHLIGLNLTRAWSWRELAAALPGADPLVPPAQAAYHAHRDAGWQSVRTETGYAATHWIGSFAAYLELGAL